MKYSIQALRIFTCHFLTILLSLSLYSQEWQTPLLKGYGEIKYFDQAAQQPDPKSEYKLIFDIKSDQLKNGVNKSLWIIARIMNLLHVGKVPPANVKIVAAIHGEASYIVLEDISYKEKFGKLNPNLDLIEKLEEQGVSIFICLQALASRKISVNDIHPSVTQAISAMAVVTNYQLKGYKLMPI